jgi:hypothetical protein
VTRTVALLAALLSASGALIAPAPPAAAAPTITVTPVVAGYYPQQVPPVASGLSTHVTVVVSSSEPGTATTVRAESPDGGLAISNPVQAVGTLEQPTTVSFDVAGVSPGNHPLFVGAQAGAFGGGTLLPYIWTSGTPLAPPTIKQYTRAYGWEGTEGLAGSQTRSVRMLSFVSPRFAYLGLPPFGLPTCTQEGNGCVPYSVDTTPAPAQVQIGTDIIAAVHFSTLYTDGLVPPDPQTGELYGRHEFHQALAFPDRSTRLRGTYRYVSHDRPVGLTFEKVSFEDDGSYRLAYAVDGGPKTRLTGRFVLGRSGRITFLSEAGRVRQRGTVLEVVRTHPRRYPYPRGIWLILSGKRAAHPDGNFLNKMR